MARKPKTADDNASGRKAVPVAVAEVNVAELDDMKLTEAEVQERYTAMGHSKATASAIYMTEHDQVNFELLCDVVAWVVSGADGSRLPVSDRGHRSGSLLPGSSKQGGGTDGAILIFLQGLKEIQTAHEMILQHPAFRSATARRWVLPLHSSLSSQEQKMVFRRPPAGLICPSMSFMRRGPHLFFFLTYMDARRSHEGRAFNKHC
jgi:hypothetical protein